MDPNFFGRCRQCKGRPAKGLDGLVGGICPRCWKSASLRIRARFESESDGELRYSFHGHARSLHIAKRPSPSRAEVLPGTDPAEGGRDDLGAQSAPAATSAPAQATTGAGSSVAPAFALVGTLTDLAGVTVYRLANEVPASMLEQPIPLEPGSRTKAEVEFVMSRSPRY
jgi:hypothetical protein